MATMKSQIATPKLVYPPMSNQEAVWFEKDTEVEAMLRQSDFYMIGGRAEARYENLAIDTDDNIVRFDFVLQDGLRDKAEIHLQRLPAVVERKLKTFIVEAGEKLVRVWNRPKEDPEAEVLDWFTTEKLLFDRSHGHPAIVGLDRHRELSSFDLFYVGIAKKGDSFDRLLKGGHKKRMDILANEPQRHPASRVTDETYLFLFEVETLGIQTFDADANFEDMALGQLAENKRVVADAEKAFVKLLDPQYNETKFPNYPKGADGLYQAGLTRYGYVLGEKLIFNAGATTIKGAFDPMLGFSNAADCIFVKGDQVRHFVAGVDFPAPDILG